MSNQNPHTVCIIGGGMSGLFTGALLAKNGYKVTVLEKNHIIGGGLQSFRRGDAVFNTGMQAFCGYGDDFALKHFIDYVGLNHDDLHFVPLDSNAQEIVCTPALECVCVTIKSYIPAFLILLRSGLLEPSVSRQVTV